MYACVLAVKFSLGENLSFFLAEPIVGGVFDVCDDVFDDVGVVNDTTAVDIDDDGVMFDGRVDVDPSDDGDVDDEVDTEMIPRPRCCTNMFRRSVDLPFCFGGMVGLRLKAFARQRWRRRQRSWRG